MQVQERAWRPRFLVVARNQEPRKPWALRAWDGLDPMRAHICSVAQELGVNGPGMLMVGVRHVGPVPRHHLRGGYPVRGCDASGEPGSVRQRASPGSPRPQPAVPGHP